MFYLLKKEKTIYLGDIATNYTYTTLKSFNSFRAGVHIAITVISLA